MSGGTAQPLVHQGPSPYQMFYPGAGGGSHLLQGNWGSTGDPDNSAFTCVGAPPYEPQALGLLLSVGTEVHPLHLWQDGPAAVRVG